MAKIDISDRYVGADWLLLFMVTGLPDGVTVESAAFYLKKNVKTADADALVSRSVTTEATAEGQITQAGTTATIAVLVPDALTRTLTPTKALYYRVMMVTNDGTSDFDEIAADGNFTPQ